MARLARVVAPGHPHHVTQRGNRRQQTFFSDGDYRAYMALMSTWCGRLNVEVWAYCLMPNHVHMIMVPETEHGLRRAIGEAHRRYTRMVNLRQGWRGHLWQGRFASFPMDPGHLLASARYVELNPVRAGLVRQPEDWPWSSAAAHLTGQGDGLCSVSPLLEEVGDWRAFLDGGLADKAADAIRRHERTGRPLGADRFVEELEQALGLILKIRRPGRKTGSGWKPKASAPSS
jgi:putative transposase